MNAHALLDAFPTMYFGFATYGVAAAFAVLAVGVPDRATAARLSLRAVSPLWILVPVLVGAGLLTLDRVDLLVASAAGTTVPVLLLVQVVVSLWVLWRYRSFPWFVVPLSLVSCWIQWEYFLAAALRG